MLIFFCPSKEKSSHHKKLLKIVQDKSQIKKDYFNFISNLMKWAAFAKSKQSKNSDRTEIYLKFSKQRLQQFGEFLETNRHILYAMEKYNDLNIHKGEEIIPKTIHLFIKSYFKLKQIDSTIETQTMLVRLIGGDFNFESEKIIHVKGLIDTIDEFKMTSWRPIKAFINNFRDTLTLDMRLSQELGRTLLPLVEYYYDYMDCISRMRIIKELASDYRKIPLSENKEENSNQLAIKIFQSSGPVMIKLLQQLQEEIIGESPIEPVLSGLKYSKPMDPEKLKSPERRTKKSSCCFKIKRI